MAECYPEMYLSLQQADNPNLLTKIIKNPKIASIYELYVARKADGILVMIEESRDRLLKKGIDKTKIDIVSNTPIIKKTRSWDAHSGDDLRIIYVGFVTKIRGIDLLIQAIRRFVDDQRGGANIRFDIIGIGSATDTIKNLILELNLENHVFLHGWLDKADMQTLFEQANVGALTYRICSHWNHTIPNKIFDYMYQGLPVVATNVLPISRILKAEECGFTSNDDDIEGMAENLICLKSEEVRNRLGNNGHNAVIRSYNWQLDSERLMQRLVLCKKS